jgi:hypothetical protein
VAPDRLPNLPNHRHQRLGAALAVQIDDIGACRLEPLAGVDDIDTVKHLFVAMDRERHHDRKSGRLHHVERDRTPAVPVDRLSNQEIGAFFNCPADLFLEYGADGIVRLRVFRLIDVGIADVTGHQTAVAARDILGDAQRLAIDLSRMPS